MSQVGFKVNVKRCLNCRACAVACKAELNTPLGVRYRRVIERQDGSDTSAKRVFTSMACFHCTNPACVKACPAGAAYKRDGTNGDIVNDGVVLFDQSKCVGCRRCEWVCPYGAPQYNANSGKVEKCTFCAHRIAAGWDTGNTACAATCIGKALKGYGSISADTSKYVANKLADPALTNPNVTIIDDNYDEA